MEENRIYNNAESGVYVAYAGSVLARRNEIVNNRHAGIYIANQGGGTFEDNNLSGNRKGGLRIMPDSEQNVIRARNLE